MKKKLLFLSVVFLIAPLGFFLEARQSRGLPNSLGMKMIRIAPGTFPMDSSIKRDLWNEQPVHEVTISHTFNISKTEVTVEQFRQFKPDFEGTPSNAPYASGMSWHHAKAFTEWLSRKEGKPYRVPTEAESKYVARAGSDDPQSQAKNQLEKPNAWGVKNMLAGPREWCLDWFGEYPSVNQIDPVGPEGRTDLEATRVYRVVLPELEWEVRFKRVFANRFKQMTAAEAARLVARCKFTFTDAMAKYVDALTQKGITLEAQVRKLAGE